PSNNQRDYGDDAELDKDAPVYVFAECKCHERHYTILAISRSYKISTMRIRGWPRQSLSTWPTMLARSPVVARFWNDSGVEKKAMPSTLLNSSAKDICK